MHAGLAPAQVRAVPDMCLLTRHVAQTLVKNYLMLTAAMEQQNLGRFQGMLGCVLSVGAVAKRPQITRHSVQPLQIRLVVIRVF